VMVEAVERPLAQACAEQLANAIAAT
jgi:hypothetical protein